MFADVSGMDKIKSHHVPLTGCALIQFEPKISGKSLK